MYSSNHQHDAPVCSFVRPFICALSLIASVDLEESEWTVKMENRPYAVGNWMYIFCFVCLLLTCSMCARVQITHIRSTQNVRNSVYFEHIQFVVHLNFEHSIRFDNRNQLTESETWIDNIFHSSNVHVDLIRLID